MAGEPADPLVGRDEDLAAVCRSLEVHRLVTLTGAGGVGKTALALAVSRAAAESGVRVVNCELADIADPDSVRSVLAARMKIRLHGQALLGASLPPPADGDSVLVVLDNCEHVLDAAAEVAGELLLAGPHLRVLATSREPLRLAEERVHVVPPLAVPASAVDPDAVRSPAVLLFARDAADANAAFVLDGASLPDVLRVCRRLDGLPLAVKIAAARVSAFSPAEIAGQLSDQLSLRAATRSAPERHRSIRAVVAWSYALLAPAHTRPAARPGGGPERGTAVGRAVERHVRGIDRPRCGLQGPARPDHAPRAPRTGGGRAGSGCRAGCSPGSGSCRAARRGRRRAPGRPRRTYRRPRPRRLRGPDPRTAGRARRGRRRRRRRPQRSRPDRTRLPHARTLRGLRAARPPPHG